MKTSQALSQLHAFVADDSHSCTFQTFGQYRAALLNKITTLTATTPPQKSIAREAADTFAQDLIAQGWHNGSETYVDGLQALLMAFLSKQIGEVKT